jgi:hypothetical protein
MRFKEMTKSDKKFVITSVIMDLVILFSAVGLILGLVIAFVI